MCSLPHDKSIVLSLGKDESRQPLEKLKNELKGFVRMSDGLHYENGLAKLRNGAEILKVPRE